MPDQLRVMTWNIAEGSNDRRGEPNSAIPAIADAFFRF